MSALNMLRREHVPAVALTALFGALYGALLVATHGLPYVMDNNETFSSLWHAANLFHFGLAHSWGLADEAFSPHAAAHPYVHTHQGNFPRLFAFLIYVMGARSAESQIVITTFTIGLAGLLLAYAFFARIATRWFAFTVSAVFMTDYVLFAQWEVVTYRVWYAFIFFSCLLCMDRAVDDSGGRWRWGMAFAFACLFYFELVFAAFVAIFCGLYAIARCWRTPRRLAWALMAQALGAAAGLATMCIQAIGYLGLEGFRRDIYFTFLARNDFSSVAGLLHKAGQFYADRHAIFWYNIQDRAQFASLGAFVRSFTAFDWRIQTPLLAISVWTVVLGWLLALCPRVAGSERPAGRFATALAYALLFVGTVVFCRYGWLDGAVGTLPPALIGAAVVGVVGALLAREASGGPLTAGTVRTLASTGGLLGALGLLVGWHVTLFDPSYRPMWQALQSRIGPPALQTLMIAASAAVALYLAVAGARRVLGNGARERLAYVALYLACGAAAYAVVFVLSPGYLYSGYLVRQAPFTVFLTDVMVAVAAYVVARAAVRLLGDTRLAEFGADWGSSMLVYARGSLAAFATALAMSLAAYWLVLQSSYLRWLPPTHYAFLKVLASPPFRGASFVVDNYAAPVAAYTGQWAYMDPAIEQARLTVHGGVTRIQGSARYLWLADRSSNSAYRRPQYFLCMVPQSLATVLARIQHERGEGPAYPGCSARPLVQFAAKHDPLLPGFTVVALDRRGASSIGFDSWAIVRLDLDNPRHPVVLDWNADASLP